MRHDVKESPLTATRYDVAIVGGGMVGGTLALLLGRQGFRVAVIEAGDMSPRWQPENVNARVSALTEASRQLFETLGLWPHMIARRVTPYTQMTVWDGAGSGEIHFNAEDVMAPALGHIVENSVITDALCEALQQQDTICCWPSAQVTQVSEARPAAPYGTVRTLTLNDGRTLEAAVVVAADGARSPLRRMAGIGTKTWDTHQQAVVTVVTHERAHQQQAQQVFLPTGPLAFLPLEGERAEGHMSSIVWSADTAEAERLMVLEDDDFAVALAEAFEQRLGSITSVGKRAIFPLVQRHAAQYVQPSLALVGDAAHGIHPLAGQGANLGFLDAAVLAEELGRAYRQGAPISDQRVLARYEWRRRMDNATMLKAMEAFCRGFGEQNIWVKWARNAGLRAVDRCAPLKRFFIRQALGDRPDLPETMKA
ncbi:UbiH/UbiF/VisC/COQ6 family ubiquinone biosynthesis hydroxylase [Zymobacter palmae]|uniref:2-polyprenyl-6-methoxyphenol hydroxylase n=1 Tax=Zymobacter palmae TaxID=33074 RepID=A0A348HBG5_9GAMM|nr:UbiH/UbiF/VisC/COQ6 family ubiquinone biosynthesis hydroxylase [Zymobacter palmae]BBG28967.1 2-polyprenyl-6-methoxyphenol hydroxylase [Zymobacter palmae]